MTDLKRCSVTAAPSLGDWWAACCECDLEQIINDDDLVTAKNYFEFGPFAGSWSTKEAALKDLEARGLLLSQE